ncbi:MAG: acyl-CoA dehydrogenase family protein [Chloroflexi bacterium]|nr:acyl-CoA dehydrogenase family protein [Chloroflexota bacterium]
MAFEIPEELKMLRDTVRRFVYSEVIPLEKELPVDTVEIPEPHIGRLQGMAKEMGLWCLDVPEEFGGPGIGLFGQVIVGEEMGHCLWVLTGTSTPIFGGDIPAALYESTEDQKEHYLYPSIRGEKKSAFGQTEPGAGADPSMLATTAVRDGDNWILNGTKIFITGGDKADFVMIFARIPGTTGRNGVTCFLVDKGTPGFKVARLVEVIRPLYPSELVLEDCVVPDANRLGEVGRGFMLAQDFLTHGRITYAARPLGMASRSLKMAIDYSKQRTTFGRLLAERQAVQWMLVDSEIELRAARWLTWDAAFKAERGEDVRSEASIAKVYSTEMVGRVVDRAIQIHGGLGVSKDLILERWYREARVMRIGEGPSEIHRFIIARNLLRD